MISKRKALLHAVTNLVTSVEPKYRRADDGHAVDHAQAPALQLTLALLPNAVKVAA